MSIVQCNSFWALRHPRLTQESFNELSPGSMFYAVVISNGAELAIPYKVTSVRVRGWRVWAERLVPSEPWMQGKFLDKARGFCFGDEMFSFQDACFLGEEHAEPKKEGHPVDTVAHPTHYTSHPSGVECIQVVEHMTFNLGCVIKYLWRAGLKDGEPAMKDLKKAQWYITREIARLEKDKKK